MGDFVLVITVLFFFFLELAKILLLGLLNFCLELLFPCVKQFDLGSLIYDFWVPLINSWNRLFKLVLKFFNLSFHMFILVLDVRILLFNSLDLGQDLFLIFKLQLKSVYLCLHFLFGGHFSPWEQWFCTWVWFVDRREVKGQTDLVLCLLQHVWEWIDSSEVFRGWAEWHINKLRIICIIVLLSGKWISHRMIDYLFVWIVVVIW